MTMLFIGNGLEMYFTYVSLHIYKDVLITFGIDPDHRPNKAYHFICLNKPKLTNHVKICRVINFEVHRLVILGNNRLRYDVSILFYIARP